VQSSICLGTEVQFIDLEIEIVPNFARLDWQSAFFKKGMDERFVEPRYLLMRLVGDTKIVLGSLEMYLNRNWPKEI
jgi:hypothetical protein